MYRNIILLALSNGLGISTAVVSLTISSLAAGSIGLEGGWLTVPYGIQFAALLFFTLPIAKIMEKLGRKYGFIISSIFGALGGLAGYYGVAAAAPVYLFLAHLLIGLNLATVNYYRFAAFDLANEATKPIAMSLVVFGGTFAAFIGPMVTRNANLYFPSGVYEAAYLAIGVLCLVILALMVLTTIPHSKMKAVKAPLHLIKMGLQNPVLWGGMLASAVGYGLMNILMISAGIEMNKQGIRFIPITYAIQMHVLAMFVPSLFMGKFIKYFGAKSICLVGCLMMAAGTLTAWYMPVALIGFQVALIFYGLGWNMLFVAGSYLAVHEAPSEVTIKFQAYNNLIIGVMTMLSSTLAGFALSSLGWQSLNMVMMWVVVILFAGLILSFYRLKQQPYPAI
ncbi:MAG: MFS transporter [Alphaproteobacteria bacterium]